MAYKSNLAMKNTEIENASPRPEIVQLDLARFDSREMVQDALKIEAAENKETPKAAKSKISIFSILYGLAFAAMALLLLFNYLNLTVLTDKVSNKKTELETMENRESFLRTEYEKRLDLRSIEDYTVNTLGMIKTERGQVEYIEIKAPEQITMVAPEENGNLSYYLANLVKSFNAVLRNLD